MRALSAKIILGDSQQRENLYTEHKRHTIPYMKFKLKLLHIKCNLLEFTKDEAQMFASKDNSEFCGSGLSLTVKHTLFTLEESGPPQMTYTCESQ
jgi:hypothetical protein